MRQRDSSSMTASLLQVGSEGGGYPVDGGLERGSEGEAQRFVGGVSQTDGGPDGFTGGVRQLEVSVHSLRFKN